MKETTVEIVMTYSFTTPEPNSVRPALRIITEREQKAAGGWKTVHGPSMTLVANTVPELLDQAKKLYQQEGSWEGIVELSNAR